MGVEVSFNIDLSHGHKYRINPLFSQLLNTVILHDSLDIILLFIETPKYYAEFPAVDKISFEVKRGETFGFLGPNGAGKTATIRMLTGLSKPSSGNARILGYDISSEIVKAKKCFGEVPELSNMYDELSGLHNLVFMGQLYGIPASDRMTRATELLKLFGLYEKKDSLFSTYSKGMKRALTIAAALVHQPQIMFLDEPTVVLDVAAARSLRALIEHLHEQGVTVFLTTHYLEEADRLWLF